MPGKSWSGPPLDMLTIRPLCTCFQSKINLNAWRIINHYTKINNFSFRGPVGILHLLDDESNFPKASDYSFLEKCHYNHALNELYSRPRMSSMEFGIKHYAGQVTLTTQPKNIPVHYAKICCCKGVVQRGRVLGQEQGHPAIRRHEPAHRIEGQSYQQNVPGPQKFPGQFANRSIKIKSSFNMILSKIFRNPAAPA